MLGLDVLLSGDGCAPRLIEINGNPSLSVEFERETATPDAYRRHVSPVDVAVKRRALGDALRIAAAGALPHDADAAALRSYWPVVTAANPIPPALSSLNECRLLYEARGVVERLNRESARFRLTRVAPRQPRRRWCPPRRA